MEMKKRGHRNIDGLRITFDHLKTDKKPNGSSACPANVLRAKRIGREIVEKICAVSVGVPRSGDEGSNDVHLKEEKSVLDEKEIRRPEEHVG